MKLINFKIVPLVLAGFAFFILSGCDGTTGTSSDTGLVSGTEPVKPIYDTNTSALIGDGSTTFSNSSRNVVTDSNGYIYVAYHGTNGIYVSMSKDSGTTFTTPIQISTANEQVSISVSTNGTVYVAWVDAGSVFLSRSLDGGATYTIPVDLGSLGGGSSVHMDTDGSNIYMIQQAGGEVAYSNDNGENFSITALNTGAAFSDIRVDKNNHYVYVTTDDPTIYYYVSTDFGDTFSSAVVPGGSIFYSTTAISSGINGRYIFVSGDSTNAYRIDLDTNTSTQLVFGQNDSSQGRSLSADSFGNVVDGYFNGTTVYFAVSYNLGDTFSTAIEVDVDSSDISVTIDPVNNKVVVAYHKQGQVYVKTYAGLL